MAEWSKAQHWKCCVGASLPWVRIPLSPPFIISIHNYSEFNATVIIRTFDVLNDRKQNIPFGQIVRIGIGVGRFEKIRPGPDRLSQFGQVVGTSAAETAIIDKHSKTNKFFIINS